MVTVITQSHIKLQFKITRSERRKNYEQGNEKSYEQDK